MWERLRAAALRTGRRDMLALGCVLGALGGVAAVVQASGFRIPLTASLPRGVYRVAAGPPTRGAVGLWCLPAGIARWSLGRGYLTAGRCPGGAAPVGKVVLAAAGDTVLLGPRGAEVNGSWIPNTRPLARDARGRPLTPATYGVYVLGAGEVWLWSPFAVRSYDSRYFGPIPVEALVSHIRPVLTTAGWAPWITPGAACGRSGRS